MTSNRYDRYDAEQKPCNPIRILEWILCAICLTLGIYILLQLHRVDIILKSILIVVAGAYCFITAVDIIVTSLLKPLLWTSWIIFALMAALAFFVCTGLLMFGLHHFGVILYSAVLTANGITGLVFLFELLYIICWLLNKTDSIEFNKESPYSTTSQSTSAASTPSSKIKKRNDKVTQFPGNDVRFIGNNRSVQCPSDTFLRRGKFTCTKDSCPKKFASVEVPSHGGTFHVSKDVAPILSPSPLPSSRDSCSCENTSVKYPRVSFEPDSLVVTSQKGQDQYGNLIEEALTVKSRTVSTSARIVPKQNHETTYTVTVKNVPSCSSSTNPYIHEESVPNEQCGTRQTLGAYCRPHSSPVSSQTPALTSAVEQYYTCSYCGGTHLHQHIATVQPISNRESYDMYKCQRLPTLQENRYYYSPTDEPTKDCSCCPCSSPTTTNGSNKLPPSSGTAANRQASRINSIHTSPHFGSPFVDRSMVSLEYSDIFESSSAQPSFASSLTNKAHNISEYCYNQPIPPTNQSQQSCFCNRPKVSTAKTVSQQETISTSTSNFENLYTVKGAAAVFGFQPHCKNEEKQTPSHKLQKQNDCSCTSHKDYKQVSTNPQIYFESNYYSKENNYIRPENIELSGWEPDCCLCETQRLKLVKAEADTVLPGAADRSPRDTVSAERYVMIHPEHQRSSVIDINDDISNVCVGYLVPTKCHGKEEPTTDTNEKRPELQRRQSKCILM